MTILKNSLGHDEVACDGCGRTDAGPGQPLDIKSYSVHNPNVGSATRMHYCPGCAANRGLDDEVATVAGWNSAPAPAAPAAQVTEEPRAGRRR